MASEVFVLDQTDLSVAAEVLSLQRAAYRVEADLIESDEIPPLHDTLDDVSSLDLVILGAREQSDLVAIVGYRRIADLVDIDRLAVHPSRFRHGIAARLLREVHQREKDARRFEVSTGARNWPAVEFYTRLGYRRLPDDTVSSDLLIAHFVRP